MHALYFNSKNEKEKKDEKFPLIFTSIRLQISFIILQLSILIKMGLYVFARACVCLFVFFSFVGCFFFFTFYLKHTQKMEKKWLQTKMDAEYPHVH